MSIKIDRKIVKYAVQKPEEKAEAKPLDKVAQARMPAQVADEFVRDKNGHTAKVIRMHEKLERPEMLIGSTYKIKTPISDHAMYVTINDIVLNEGTEYEQRRPFEVFINSKNLGRSDRSSRASSRRQHRKGGDVTFLVDELKAVFDAARRLLAARRQVHASIIAELGHVIEKHLQSIGLYSQDSSSTCTSRSWWMRSAPSSRRAPSKAMPSPSRISRKARSCADAAAPPPWS